MISESKVKSDIKRMEEDTGSLIFLEDDLRKNMSPKCNFDAEMFFNRTENIFGYHNKTILSSYQLISPSINGGYKLRFCKDDNYSGICYKIGGHSLILAPGNKSFANQYVIYHEAAHAYQNSLNLFDETKVNKLYEFCKKGLKKAPESELAKKMASELLYNGHLREAHSETFAAAVMRLNADSKKEKMTARLKNWANSVGRMATSFISPTKDSSTGQSKQYSFAPCLKAFNKRYKAYKKSGELKKFYNQDGSVNFKALAVEIEDVVLKHTYSPKVFKDMVDYKIFAKKKNGETGWRRATLNSFIMSPVVSAITGADEIKDIAGTIKHRSQNIFLDRKDEKRYDCLEKGNEYEKALLSFIKIDNSLVKLNQGLNKIGLNGDLYVSQMVYERFQDGRCFMDDQTIAKYREQTLKHIANKKDMKTYDKLTTESLNLIRSEYEKNKDNYQFKRMLLNNLDRLEGRDTIYQQAEMILREQRSKQGKDLLGDVRSKLKQGFENAMYPRREELTPAAASHDQSKKVSKAFTNSASASGVASQFNKERD